MRLTFEPFDGRSWNVKSVIDQDTGREVGFIHSNGSGNGGGIFVSLFDNKYATTVHHYEECRGFVKGVEAVLDHMVSAKDQSDSKAA
jgi:hypothetical protein